MGTPSSPFSSAGDAGHAAGNADQVVFWNDASGPVWVRHARAIEKQLEPLGLAAIEVAAPAPGESVVDVGCGCGSTVLELAARVSPGGRVLGLDISAPMLGLAAERVADLERGTVELRQADAQTAVLEPGSADLLFSRFGVMFFADPVAAFRNLRGALRAGGRLTFVCWQPPECNPWMVVPMAAAARVVELPPPPPPDAPGPFAFGDPDRVRSVLTGSGYAGIRIEPLERSLLVAGGVGAEEAAAFLIELGPAARALRDAPPESLLAARESIAAALLPFLGRDGVELPGRCWIVSATNPESTGAQE